MRFFNQRRMLFSGDSIYLLRLWFSRYPSVYMRLYKLFGKKQNLLINEDTSLVIEGFPRSANSFAVVAFEQSQVNNVHIAHHLHNAAQILAAVKFHKPAIVLIRHPVDAIASLLVRDSRISIVRAFIEYIVFYETITPYAMHYVLGRFEEVTENYGHVISKLNTKFGTNYKLFDHNESSVNAVFQELDHLELDGAGVVKENQVARPAHLRKPEIASVKLRLQSVEYKQLLERAINVYKKINNLS